MSCIACGGSIERGDSYCRACGKPVESRLLPVPVARRLPAERQATVPQVVAGGMAAFVLGKVARWALKQAVAGLTQKMDRRSLPAPPKAASSETGGMTLPPGSRVVTRVWWHTEIYVPPAPVPSKRPRRWFLGR